MWSWQLALNPFYSVKKENSCSVAVQTSQDDGDSDMEFEDDTFMKTLTGCKKIVEKMKVHL